MKFVLAACLAAAASAEGLRKAETEIESNHLDLELEINGERKLMNVSLAQDLTHWTGRGISHHGSR